MDINKLVNTIGVIIAGLLIVWFINATKRDNNRNKKNKK
jgi:hypothetical protein